MVKWKLLYKGQADQIINDWNLRKLNSPLVNVMAETAENNCKHLHNNVFDYALLRSEICNSYFHYKNDLNYSGYQLDIRVGKTLFALLRKYDFTVRQASNKEIWTYISYLVLPDVIQDRWMQDKPEEIARDHFDAKMSRSYFRSLWWYYHLGLVDGDNFYNTEDVSEIENCIDKTFKILCSDGLSTDTIVSLVERSGSDGYRVDLCRKIIHHLCCIKNKDNKLLRRAMVKNTFQLAVLEPEFVPEGIDAYIQNLFDSVKKDE